MSAERVAEMRDLVLDEADHIGEQPSREWRPRLLEALADFELAIRSDQRARDFPTNNDAEDDQA